MLNERLSAESVPLPFVWAYQCDTCLDFGPGDEVDLRVVCCGHCHGGGNAKIGGDFFSLAPPCQINFENRFHFQSGCPVRPLAPKLPLKSFER